MVSGIVRPIALCVIRRHGNLLVFEGYDTVKKDHFYRPLGGTIEFGERSSVTAAREMVEELNTEIRNVRWLGVLENIFTVHGQPGHEIVMLYEADFVDKGYVRAAARSGDKKTTAHPSRPSGNRWTTSRRAGDVWFPRASWRSWRGTRRLCALHQPTGGISECRTRR